LLQTVREFAAENEGLVEAMIAMETQPAGAQDLGPTQRGEGTSGQMPAQQRENEVGPVSFVARRQNNEQSLGSRQWTPEQAAKLDKLIHLDSYRRVWMGSLEITELIRRRLEQDLSSIAAAELARLGAPALSALAAVSSPSPSEVKRSRSFWFNVNAELIIYGATDPGATVTIGDKPITLRPDGSFSYRFALPDGRYELPAAAISPDNEEKRHAVLRFSRFSEFQGNVEAHPQDESLKHPAPENT
jgi:hypothetical protein